MNFLEFLSSIISSLAWPAAVVTFLVLFRENLGMILTGLQLSKFKAGNVEAEFNSQVEQAQATILKAELSEDVGSSPAAIVSKAWREAEDSLVGLSKARFAGTEGMEDWTSQQHIDRLETEGLLSDELKTALDQLRRTSQSEELKSKINKESAEKFVEVAAHFVGALARGLF